MHRGSRASSRKSSRASDASDLSELGGPWLNLPLLLLSGATGGNALLSSPEDGEGPSKKDDVSIKISEATPEQGEESLIYSVNVPSYSSQTISSMNEHGLS